MNLKMSITEPMKAQKIKALKTPKVRFQLLNSQMEGQQSFQKIQVSTYQIQIELELKIPERAIH